MKISFGHEATTSFTLWFEHHLLEHGEAYNNMTGNLFVPNDLSGAGTSVDKEDPTNGYYIDFNNGGIVVTGAAASANMNWSGAFSLKEFNIYNTNHTEESLVIEGKFDTNSRFTVIESGIAPYDFVTPAIFINNEYIENEPFAFGGEDKTVMNFKSVVFAENLYQLDGVLSLFADTRNVAFSSVDFGAHPINEYGDIKTGKYSYDELATEYKSEIFNIERVNTSKISESIRSSISPSLYVGFLDFEVTKAC